MENLRLKMYEAIEKHGLGSEEALKLSEELDILVAEAQKKNSMHYLNIPEDTTITNQLRKVSEEQHEFILAVRKRDIPNIIEEFFDMIQASLGIIQIMKLDDKLKDGLKRHNIKLRYRGWKFKDII